MRTITLFSNWDNSKPQKYYYNLGRLNKDGSVKYTVVGGCSNDEAEVGEKVKYVEGTKVKYLTVIGKTTKEEK